MPINELDNNPDVMLNRFANSIKAREELQKLIDQIPVVMRSCGTHLTREDIQKFGDFISFACDLNKRETEEMLKKREDIRLRMLGPTAPMG